MNLETPLAVTATIALILTLHFLAKTWGGEAIRHKFHKDEAAHASELSTAENTLLAELRKLNTQLQTIQAAANSAFVEGQRVSAEWRVKAVDEFWQEWIEVVRETPAVVRLWDLSGPDQDLRGEPAFAALMEQYSQGRVIRPVGYGAERHQPFVGDEACFLLSVYRMAVVFCSDHMDRQVAGENTEPWFADDSVLGLLRIGLSESEVEQFQNRETGHLLFLQMMIQGKLLTNLRKIIAGEISAGESLEQGVKVLAAVQELEATRIFDSGGGSEEAR